MYAGWLVLCFEICPCPISERGKAFNQLSKQQFLTEHALKMARAAYQTVKSPLNSEGGKQETAERTIIH